MKEPKIRFEGFGGEWKEKSIASIASLKAGKSIDTSQEISYPSQGYYPCYGGNGLRGYVRDYTHEGIYNIIGRQGALCGNVKIASGKFHATEHAVVVSPTQHLDAYFLYNLLTKANINQYATGVAQPGLSVQNLNKSLLVIIPKFDEQQAIGSYFQHLDSLIQSTTKKIESLKQVKAASLQSMFPQEGETKPRVRFKGFENEWEKVAIKDIATINPKTNIPNIFEYVDLESVVGTELKSHRTETKQTAPSRAQRLASNGDIFYQTVRPYQKNNLYFDLNEDNFVFSSGYAQIRANLCGAFLFAVMQQDSFIQKVMDNCTGTSFPAINANVLGTLKIMVTKDIVEQTAIASFFTNLDKQITLQTQRLEKLKQIKSACLDNMFV